MASPVSRLETVRFGVFELDLRAGELRKNGSKLKLQEQPLQVLAVLVEKPGEVVLREELRERLWPDDAFGDFDHSLSTAINKIRQVLGDSASHPRFIETVPRRGYRFLAEVSPAASDGKRYTSGTARQDRPEARRAMYALAAIGTLALVALLWALRPPPPAARLEPIRAVPLTTYPGSEVHPSFSPDGEQTAFSWDGPDGHNFDIYIKALGQDEPRRLSFDSREELDPAWSPDGRSIAWLRSVSEAGEAALEIVQAPVVGGAEHLWSKIDDPRGGAPRPLLAWAPDGKSLVVVDRNSETERSRTALFFLSSDGSRRRLTAPPEPSRDSGPAISPDGRALAFVRAHGMYRSDVYLLDLAEDRNPLGEPRRLTYDNDLTSGLSWTADGRSLVYSAGSFAQAELWRLPVSKADPSRERLGLPSRAGGGSTSIASLGGRLAFAQDTLVVNIYSRPLRAGPAGSASPQRIIASSGRDYNPQFSPDGARIAFSSDRIHGEVGIFLADADGSNVERLYTDPEAHSGTPRWSPDGQRIAFDSNRGETVNIFVISVNGGTTLQLTSAPGGGFIPSWSHDGEWVYFASLRTGRPEIWKQRLGAEEAAQVTTNGGFVAFESPDGRYLYYLKGSSSPLYRMSVLGGDEEQIVDSVVHRNIAVNEDGVYFISALDGADEPRYRIGKYDPASGAVETIELFPEGVEPRPALAVSKVAGSIAYAQVDRIESDLMLVENFH